MGIGTVLLNSPQYMKTSKIFIATCQICLFIYLTSCKSPQNTLKSDANSEKNKKVSIKGDKVTTYAEKFLGSKYKMAGTTPAGFDCSGYCQFVYNEFGISLPRTSDEQAKIGKTVPTNQAQKGDLIFFRGSNKNKPAVGHVGIVVSSPGERVKFIHASTSKGVIHDYLDVKYFSERFVTIKRIW